MSIVVIVEGVSTVFIGNLCCILIWESVDKSSRRLPQNQEDEGSSRAFDRVVSQPKD